MKKLILIALFLLIPALASAWTVIVEFTPPLNPDYVTVVLVSEVSGDYSQAYGQRSDPGAPTVKIGNIKPSTTYYFVARRYNPVTWQPSEKSEEFPYTTGDYAEPILNKLPDITISAPTSLTIIWE